MPIALILGWVRNNWKTVAFGLAIVVLSIYIGSLKLRLGSAQGEVAKLTGENAAIRSANVTLTRQVEQQNAAVQAMEGASIAARKRSTELLAQAARQSTGLQQQAAWLAEQLAKPDARTKGCADAFKEWRMQP